MADFLDFRAFAAVMCFLMQIEGVIMSLYQCQPMSNSFCPTIMIAQYLYTKHNFQYYWFHQNLKYAYHGVAKMCSEKWKSIMRETIDNAALY